MVTVKFLPFSEPRRNKCRICNQRLPLSHLALFIEYDKVEGEMELCSRCYILMTEVIFGEDGSDNEMMSEEVLQ